MLHCYPGKDAFFLAVADGMGGVAGGQIASQTVLSTAENTLDERFEAPFSVSDLRPTLHQVFENAHASIRDIVSSDPSLDGMGTTLTCVLGYEDRFVVGNLGDSRVYYLTGGEMHQVTKDHSYLEEFKEKSGSENLDPEFVAQYGHIISKTLDGSGDEPDIFPLDDDPYDLHDQDAFLLCSDGMIVDKLQEQEQLFASYIMGTSDLRTAAESLVSLAYYSGSTDNISVVLAEAGEVSRDLGRVRTYPFPPRQEERVQ